MSGFSAPADEFLFQQGHQSHGNHGLGYFSRRMMTQLDGAAVFAPIVLLSAVAMIAVGLVSLLEKKFVRWRGES